jgi:acyl-CoA hydrolase
MSSNRSPDGLTMLARMADAAAARAAVHIARPVHLAACDRLDIRDIGEGVATLEIWPVRQDERAITLSVFATVHPAGGGVRLAASGRFTFTSSHQTREYRP